MSRYEFRETRRQRCITELTLLRASKSQTPMCQERISSHLIRGKNNLGNGKLSAVRRFRLSRSRQKRTRRRLQDRQIDQLRLKRAVKHIDGILYPLGTAIAF